MQPSTAKINRKRVRRTVISLVIVGLVFYGGYWLLSKGGDPDRIYGPADTVGDVAAVQELSNGGSQAVIIKPDGTILPSPDYTAGATDSNVAWRADGGRLFFESDRYNNQPHLFRWNPDRSILERRTTDKRAKGFLSFGVPGSQAGDAKALMISGGTVLEIDANTGDTKQILPPFKKNAPEAQSNGENGQQSSMEQAYSQFGNSFARAMWLKNKKAVIAILSKDTGDQALIMQDLSKPDSKPEPMWQARHIGFDVNQITGDVVVAIQGFEIPDWLNDQEKERYRQGDKLVPPFRNGIGIITFDPTVSVKLLVRNNSDQGFGDPAISPDGSQLAIATGIIKSGNLEVQGVTVVPLSGGAPRPLVGGDFHDVSWSPDGKQLSAIVSNKAVTDVVLIDSATGQVKDLTNGKGTFSEAVISPQQASP